MTTSSARPTTARDALAFLREGNDRFARDERVTTPFAARRAEITAGQSPFAIVLSCSDSRAPAEYVFDCGLGDLFVVRVAGNVCAPSLIGSVEFAASKFGTPLVVVMGHTGCGAIAATIDTLRAGPPSGLSSNVLDIVQRITPAVAEIALGPGPLDELVRKATRANVRATVNQLRHGSRTLEDGIAAGTLAVVGAEYALDTGVVDFFDVPEALAG